MPTKYILVSGGVVSGVGKGLCASSIGALLKCCNYNVTAVKLDPYLNVDERLMSAKGDVFVLDDGSYVSSDIGNYERFLGIRMSKDNHITTGKVYNQVIEKEREGKTWMGKTVQVVPHVTNEIQDCIIKVGETPIVHHDGTETACDFVIVELGGTVGDMESLPFIESLRQLRQRVGEENFCSVLVSLIPTISGPEGEPVQKTKPTQHGVKELRYRGLDPDVIICRSEETLSEEARKSVSMYCHVPLESVLSVVDVANVWRIPNVLQAQGMCNLLNKTLALDYKLPVVLEKWHKYAEKAQMVATATKEARSLRVVLVVPDSRSKQRSKVGDANLSTLKALRHAAIAMSYPFTFEVINAAELQQAAAMASPEEEESGGRTSPGGSLNSKEAALRRNMCDAWRVLREADAVLLNNTSHGEGSAASFEGQLNAIRHARETKTPFLGLGIGMHLAVIEAARNLGGMPDANSLEIVPECAHPVVVPTNPVDHCFGSLKTSLLDKASLSSRLYMGADTIYPRYCQAFQMNPEFAETAAVCGLQVVARSDRGTVAAVERTDHPFFMGVDYHAEYTTRPGSPSPVFLGLLLASRPASSAAALTGGGAEAELSALGGDVSMLSELLPLGSTVAHADYVALLSPALW